MDAPALKAFVTVADSHSFSQAAQQLYLTQPAVSKRITRLELDLDARLFDRIGRSTTLTEAGRSLLPHARRILNEMADSRRVLANLSGRVEGRLSIGTSHHIGLHRLPPVLRSYTRKHPEVELDFHFVNSEAACIAVERGALELGVVTLPLAPVAILKSTPVWDDPLGFVIAVDHPLAKAHNIGAKQLLQYPAILPLPGTFTREIVERTFSKLGMTFQVRLATNYLETIKMLVSIGLGWGVLPLSMLDTARFDKNRLRVLDIKGLNLRRVLGVVRHRKRTLSNAAQALIGLLEACRT